jgi:hypothetical protein
VILDNYASHKHPKVLAWLSRHPGSVFHFTPTSCSWLNAVETFFATLTKQRLRRGVFRTVVGLQAAINRYIASTMSSRSLSSGPPILTGSSPPSAMGCKRRSQSTGVSSEC